MRLAPCQYCGHCEKFICEAQAKASPETLLYPVLASRPGFEIRLRCQVLDIDYDKQAKRATGVRYLDLESGEEYEQPADVVVVAAFTMSNTRLLLLSGIGTPYDPATGTGTLGRNFCYQTNSAVNVFMKDRWINPFLASGSTGITIDEFNNDNFDPHPASASWAAPASAPTSPTAARSAIAGCRPARRDGAPSGGGECRMVRAFLHHCRCRGRAIRIATIISTSTPATRTPSACRCCA